MKHLMIMRHGDAESAAAGADSARVLSTTGKSEVKRQGQQFVGEVPERIVASSAKRTKETALCFAESVGLSSSLIELKAGIYQADGSKLAGILRTLDDQWQHVLLVGHMPGIAQLTHLLLKESVNSGDYFPTAVFIDLTLPVTEWKSMQRNSASLNRVSIV